MKAATATIFALYFMLAFGYSVLMPIWEAPDEAAHYHLAWSIARKGEFPSHERNYESYQPRPYYYFASVFISLLDRIDPDYSDYDLPEVNRRNLRVPEPRYEWDNESYRFLLGVYLLRWINILFGAGALWFNWKAIKLAAPDNPNLQLAALSLAGLVPQYLHIMAAVNNDAPAAMAGAALFYLALRLQDKPKPAAGLFLAVLSVMLPLATKLVVVPPGAAVLLIVAARQFTGRSKKRIAQLGTGITAGILLVIALAYWLSPETVRFAAGEIGWRLFTFREGAFTLEYLGGILWQMLRSYWGWVGWLAVGLPGWMIGLLTGLAAAGIAASLKNMSGPPQPARRYWRIAGFMALLTIGAVARNGLTTIASQGRFVFPAIGAVSLLIAGGWHRVLPERGRRALPWAAVGLMLACNFIVLVLEVVPVYYQPFLD